MRLPYLLTLLVLISCATGQMYPSNWAPLAESSACSRIIGIYANRGEIDPATTKNYVPNAGLTPRLSDFLLETPNDRIAAANADRVEITERDSVLYMSALRGPDVLSVAQYPASNTPCSGGWLTFQAKKGMATGTGNVVLGFGQDATMLHSATDGSLVLKSDSAGAGVAYLVIPVAGRSTVYGRFARQN
jgi:hypothetical protein